ncbi:MAG: hypothetical protein KDB02_01020 [Acidimicrobiales bacterium]|nr:hypothetical protein [Acidimicrobiales bacterium]
MRFLSDEWITAVAFPSVDAVEGGFEGVALVAVTGGPDGEVRFRVTFEGGRPVQSSPGGDGDWTVSLTIAHGDARALLDGSADLNVLFMSGRMKVAGEATGPLLEMLKASKRPDLRDAVATLAAATDR